MIIVKKFLSKKEREELRLIHRSLKDKKLADRIKCILLLDQGFTPQEIRKILFFSIRTIERYKKCYDDKGVDGLLTLCYKAYPGKLTPEQEEELKEHLRNNIYLSAKDIAKYIEAKYGVKYTPEGLVIALHRLGFVYKKLKQVPAKADKEKQEEFVEKYEKLKEDLKPTEKIYFMDGVHPQHNSGSCNAWIEKGTDKNLQSNTGRQRVNINGVYSPQDNEIIFRDDNCINAESTINLLETIEAKHPELTNIFIIRDNARYYYNKAVNEYLETSRIVMIPLPTYSPNLNLIERLWRFLKKKVTYGKYYEKYQEFRTAIKDFLANDIYEFEDELNSLMTERFQIINAV